MGNGKNILLQGTSRGTEVGAECAGGLYGEANKWAGKCGGRGVTGECRDGYALRYTYSRLVEDARAFSRLMPSGGERVMLIGGGAYETAVAVLAASAVAVRLTLCSAELPSVSVGEHARGTGYGLVISFGTPPQWMDKGARHIDLSSFSATVMGEATGVYAQRIEHREGFVLSFLTEMGFESYSEDTLLFLGRAFAEMTCLLNGETVMCDSPPVSPTGVVCGLLPSVLSGGCTVYFNNGTGAEDYMRLVSPDRLCCKAETAELLLRILKRADRGAMTLPVRFKAKRGVDFPWLLLERTALSVRRRLSAARLMRIGGALKYVSVTGECPREVCRGLADFGIAAPSVLSGYGYPFAAINKSLTWKSRWRLPRGIMADICDVKGGGRGRITLSGEGLRMLVGEPILRGSVSGRYRLDGWEGLSLVTDMWGCVLQKGEIFVEKKDFLTK